jgi:hypothetical protein
MYVLVFLVVSFPLSFPPIIYWWESQRETLPEKKVVGLERDPLSLVSTTEELLDRKVAASV